MSFYSIRKKELTDIADAIRAKTGKTDGMTVEDMPKEISGIESGNKESAKASISVGVPDFGNIIIVDVPISVNTGFAKPSDVLRYYNRELLPEIPADVSKEYPYLLIMRNFTTIRLVASTAKAYFHTADDGTFRITVPTTEKVNRFDVPNSTEWLPKGESTSTYFSVNGSATWVVWWSNYDIPNGSINAEEIYFHASEPQDEQSPDATHFYYNDTYLPSLPIDSLTDYPYWVVLCWLSGNIQAIGSKNGLYFNGSTGIKDKSNATLKAYNLTDGAWVEDAKQSDKYTAWTCISNGVSILRWSNHNIPNGSETATTIYLYGTLAVPV